MYQYCQLLKYFKCNSNHEVFRKAGSKARQKKLVQKIEDDMEIDWNEVDPSDAVSILKVCINTELQIPKMGFQTDAIILERLQSISLKTRLKIL